MGARTEGTEGPGPGFLSTLFDKSQGFVILHTTIDSNTQCPVLLRGWAARQTHTHIGRPTYDIKRELNEPKQQDSIKTPVAVIWMMHRGTIQIAIIIELNQRGEIVGSITDVEDAAAGSYRTPYISRLAILLREHKFVRMYWVTTFRDVIEIKLRYPAFTRYYSNE
ncbi:hypothetical protein CAPTEDRAFT_198485 [Capitella teleta]|uniref:Uncharacterized protein n=1 Tax=Capitella teleta TaxID=283909 RepID=R7UN56_CAPTE|nr:hypothetical protein CAPTEDRAFT_198485 [Capitella teleta]|eukprot:ELU04826.1 hypothetical protein CAPTEDRAFT_198485 [Capitella teleta]